MVKRIFIAINLPDNIKEELISFKEKFYFLPAKWVKKENLHLTLIFLGYFKDEFFPKLFEVVAEVAKRHDAFWVSLKNVTFAPKNEKIPRMVWVECEKNKNLMKLQEDLENSLIFAKIPFQKEERKFHPHLTLCRIRKWEFRQMEPDEVPEVDEEINLSFKVNSIEIMESKLKRQGPDYFVLKSFKLGE